MFEMESVELMELTSEQLQNDLEVAVADKNYDMVQYIMDNYELSQEQLMTVNQFLAEFLDEEKL